EACLEYYRRSRQFPAGLMDEVRQKMRLLEERTGKRFGDATKPLLVSVRSGAKFSMPGMMDTVLNLGLNKTTVEGLARASGDARFAYDSYRRFMQMFGNVVLGLKHELFEDILLAAKRARGVTQDTELSAGDLGALTEEYRRLVRERAAQAYRQFMDVCALLEKHYRDVQDVEFTIEHGTLYLLQTRSGKRTGQAAVKIAVDMVHEKLITKEEALLRAEPASLEQLLHPRLDPDPPPRVVGKRL